MSNRRAFLRDSALSIGVFSGFKNGFEHFLSPGDPGELSIPVFDNFNTEEDYWLSISQCFTVNPSIINLNNGGVSPSPKTVQDAVKRYCDLSNEGPSYFMWRILDQGREPLRRSLGILAGCDPEEIAINRNATEALNTIIYGLDLQAGNEVIGTKQDYPNMINAWKQRASREGIVYKQIDFTFPIENDDEIVSAYENAITRDTKVIHITHVINWVGQIMPVYKICEMARSRGIKTIVDGAHSFGLLDFEIPDLGCDFFGTSLHKFLSAPIGSGLLWIKKDQIENIWPLVCNDNPKSGDIRKFETLGTRNFAIEQGIHEAIHFHNAIGKKRKEDRIRFLKNYWVKKVNHLPGIKIHTSIKDAYSCAICGVSFEGKTAAELDQFLFEKYKIHSVSVKWENIHCVRITPHVYTKLSDLDVLVEALHQFSKSL